MAHYAWLLAGLVAAAGCSAGRTEVRTPSEVATVTATVHQSGEPGASASRLRVWFESADVAVVGDYVAPRALRPIVRRPVRSVEVEVALIDGSALRVQLDADGYLDIEPTWLGAEVFVIARTGGKGAIAVEDCPWPSCKGGRNLWAARFVVEQAHLRGGDLVVPARAPAAGAFAALDAALDAAAFAETVPEFEPVPLTLRWLPRSDTQCGTTCFVGGESPHIDVLGLDEDSDHFDRQIIMHEYGHFVEDLVVGGEPVGGYHDGTPTSPALAWSEGFATWFATAASGDLTYVDSHRDGAAWYNYNSLSATAQPSGTMSQPLSEDLVVELLHRLARSEQLGVAELLAAVAELGAGTQICDLGAPGADAIDLLAQLAAARGSDWVVTAALAHGLPFDPAVSVCSEPGDSPKPEAVGNSQSPITPASLRLRWASASQQMRVDVRARAELVAARLQVVKRGADGTATTVFDAELGGVAASTIRSLDVAVSDIEQLVSVQLSWTLLGGSRGEYVTSLSTGGDDPGAWVWDDTSVVQTPTHIGVRVSTVAASSR